PTSLSGGPPRPPGRTPKKEGLGRPPAPGRASKKLGMVALGLGGHGVGDLENRLCRAVVAFERDRGCVGEQAREREDVLGAGRAEAVDRLQVVADDGEATFVATERRDDLDLERVDVLVLVDEQVVEHRGQTRAGDLVPGERPPVEQQVIEVERLCLAFALAVAHENAPDRLDVGLAPGELLSQHLRKSTLGVDRARVDVGQRRLPGKALARLGVTELLANEVNEVGAVTGVEQAQTGWEPQGLRVESNEPPGDRMEGPADDAAASANARPFA